MSVPPQLILAVVIASIYAALYNLVRNGTLRDLLFYLVAAWVGFGLGQIGGLLLGMNWLMVGSLYLLEGTILSWLMLLLMSWLRMPKKESA